MEDELCLIKRVDGLQYENLDREYIIRDPLTQLITGLNPFASIVWEKCDGTKTPEQIEAEIPGSSQIIEVLAKNNLIESKPVFLSQITRRRFLAAAVVLLPFVNASILPSSVEAISPVCLKDGDPCITDKGKPGICRRGRCVPIK